MIVVDSSGWIEYLTDGPLSGRFEPYVRRLEEVVTPAVVIYEVYKKVRRDRGEAEALEVAALLERTNVIPLDAPLSLVAAETSLSLGLPMADAIVYATARRQGVRVATCDAHFKGLPGVAYHGKGD